MGQVIPENSTVQLTIEDLYLRCIICLVFGSVENRKQDYNEFWRGEWYVSQFVCTRDNWSVYLCAANATCRLGNIASSINEAGRNSQYL
jgi:hypothetical protein